MLNRNSFQEVSSQAGINWTRVKGYEAYSVAWIDYNNDGLQDLWVAGHGYLNPTQAFPEGKYPNLYLNNGDGTFKKEFNSFWPTLGGDTHGNSLIDFDNDGDVDLFVSAGGQLGDGPGQPNQFYINENGTLTRDPSVRGLEYQIGRGRSSIWFDYNEDGLLDVVLTQAGRNDDRGQTALFEQQSNGTFINVSTQVGFNVNAPTRFAQLADLTGDGNLDLVLHGTFKFPAKVYDFSGSGFRDVTNQFPSISDPPSNINQDFAEHDSARDVAIADFNNDLRPDIFFTRSNTRSTTSNLFQGSNRIVSGELFANQGNVGFSFKTSGMVAFDTFSPFGQDLNVNVNQIFIGSSGRQPTIAELNAISQSLSSNSVASQATNNNTPGFVLSPDDPSVTGISNSNTRGLYVGYNSGSQTWEVRYRGSTNTVLRVVAESDRDITEAQRLGFSPENPSNNALSDRLWMYEEENGYVERSSFAGVDRLTNAQSVVAGDFDNDMDVDLYLANAYSTYNLPNILYDNQGDGTFIPVEQGGGANGSQVGPHILDFEIGQRLAVADYDNDGYLDIFAGSLVAKSERKTYLGEPSQLFQNQGSGNNWLKIKLQGTESNRDGIGARVIATTPDGTQQLREQGGGYHSFGQNSQVIHFGLAQNSTVESLLIQWPSGITQEFENVGINQLATVIEDGEFIGDLGGSSPNPPPPEPDNNDDEIFGDEGNNRINGGLGNDTIQGNGGDDTLKGNQGDDFLVGNKGRDIISGGIDNDRLFGGENRDVLNGNSGNDSILSQGGNDRLRGGSGDDTLRGGGGDDTLSGNKGKDVLMGDEGRDLINAGTNDDRLFGGDDRDVLNGNRGDDTILGQEGNDILRGGNGNDTLRGGIGNDTLYGGNGSDMLTGGSGSDNFMYSNPNNSSDRITDFNPDRDIIIVSGSGFGGGLTPNTTLSRDRFVIGLTERDRNDRFIYNSVSGTLSFDPDGNGFALPQLIVTLEGSPNLTNNNIFITS